jgi:hypothetical protein
MPSVSHEAPLELLRQKPMLAVALLRQAGVEVPDGITAESGSTDLSVVTTKQALGDKLTILSDASGKPFRVTINEPQREPEENKTWSWPVYLAVSRSRYHCGATLLVICYDRNTANWARQPIDTGHPDFVLRPIVIDASNTPDPADPAFAEVAPELVVLAAHTGALDLDDSEALDFAVATITPLDKDRAELYGSFIMNVASMDARIALEALMTSAGIEIHPVATRFAQNLERLREEAKAEGRAMGEAEGQTEMLLTIAAKRGIEVDERTRDRVLACVDGAMIQSWADRVLTGATAEEIFGV